MLNKPERQATAARHSLLCGWFFVGALGLTGDIARAEEATLVEAIRPMPTVTAPFTESETRVRVYTDARGRVVREVDLHLVIVDESPPFDPESASVGIDDPSVVAAAQEALDSAFEAATQGLAETFDTRVVPSILFGTDDILQELTEITVLPPSDDDELFFSERNLTTVPEPGAAVLLAVGSSFVVLRRHREPAESSTRPGPKRVDTAE